MASLLIHLTRYSSLQKCWPTVLRMSVRDFASRRLWRTNYTVPGPNIRIQRVAETYSDKSFMVADCQKNVSVRGFSSGVDDKIKQGQSIERRVDKAPARDEKQVFTHQQFDSWLEKFVLLIDSVNLTGEECLKLVEKSPRLRQIQQLVHLLNAVAIMKDIGYDDLMLRYVINRWPTVLLNVRLEILYSVLKDQRDFLFKNEKYEHLFKQITLLTNETVEERELYKMSMDKTLQNKRYIIYRHLVFPLKKLMLDNMPYESFGEYVCSRLGVEQRVVDTILGLKTYNRILNESLDIRIWTRVYNAVERISILLDLGVSKYDILENHFLLNTDDTSPIYNISVFSNLVREQKHLLGKVDLKLVKKHFYPRLPDSIFMTLGRLLQTCMNKNQLPKQQRLYLQDKSQVNAVRVFLLLTDEGFQVEELRKFIYLFGVEESKIRSYLEGRKGIEDKTSLEELEEAMKQD